MSKRTSTYLKFGSATVVILLALGFLAYTGVQESKSYYVTIRELRGMGDIAYSRRLRVAGNVEPGSIRRSGTRVEFVLVEQDQTLPVVYTGTEAPPDTFKDDSQALAAEAGSAGERSTSLGAGEKHYANSGWRLDGRVELSLSGARELSRNSGPVPKIILEGPL